MDGLKHPVTDGSFYVYRYGFAFTSVTEPANVFDAIVIRNPAKCDCLSPKLGFSEHTLNEHIDFINLHKIEKAVIIAENIDFIKECPSLKYFRIIPADTAPQDFDYSPLYEMPQILYLSCDTEYGGALTPKNTALDYSKINGLLEADMRGKGHLNFEKVKSLKRISVSGFRGKKRDLSDLSDIAALEELALVQCPVQSLNGLSVSQKISSLSLWYNRSLSDASSIIEISETLKDLSVRSCGKITDFSFLNRLHNLEYLELLGNNSLPNLNFLKGMKKLKVFNLSMNVLDGDLSLCLVIPWVNVKNRRHYNFKDSELPKDGD